MRLSKMQIPEFIGNHKKHLQVSVTTQKVRSTTKKLAQCSFNLGRQKTSSAYDFVKVEKGGQNQCIVVHLKHTMALGHDVKFL